MAVGAFERDGSIVDDSIKVNPGGKGRRRPTRLDPSAPGEPFARLPLLRPLAKPDFQVCEAGSALKIEAQLPEADAREVRVGVRKTRKYREAVHIHPSRAAWCSMQRLVIRPDVRDAAGYCNDGFRAWAAVIGGVDIAIEEHDGFGSTAEPGRARQDD